MSRNLNQQSDFKDESFPINTPDTVMLQVPCAMVRLVEDEAAFQCVLAVKTQKLLQCDLSPGCDLWIKA